MTRESHWFSERKPRLKELLLLRRSGADKNALDRAETVESRGILWQLILPEGRQRDRRDRVIRSKDEKSRRRRGRGFEPVIGIGH